MNNITYSFLVSSLAGFATLIGALVIFFLIKDDNSVGKLLGFSTGAMISLSIIDLIPKAINYANKYFKLFPSFLMVLLFVVIGILITFLFDLILAKPKDNKSLLYRTGILSMIVLVVHNIPEGMATFIMCNHDLTFGIFLAIVITIHNIPEGISISLPIYYSTGSRVKAFLYTFIAGFSELVGAVIAYYYFSSIVLEIHFAILFSIISGMMIYISIYELLPSAIIYSNKFTIVKSFFVGFIVILLYHIIFG